MKNLNNLKRKMNCILFLVLFMTGLICMSGALQSEINNPTLSEVRILEMAEISEPPDLEVLNENS